MTTIVRGNYQVRRQYGRMQMRYRYADSQWTCAEIVGDRTCKTPIEADGCPNHPSILDTTLLACLPLGKRIKYLRTFRHLNQQEFADLLGYSKSWVDKVERGVRALDRLTVLRSIADLLRVDVQVLITQPIQRQRTTSTTTTGSTR
jgi:DNA-binding XRE family transcriptional regulator